MKAELSKDVRIRRNLNYDVLHSIERRISNQIRAEFESEISDIKGENEKFYKEERDFMEQTKKILRKISPQTLVRVRTQVGKNSEVIQEYIGHIQREFKYNDGTFNFISTGEYDDKPFTIGFSCLLSFEVL